AENEACLWPPISEDAPPANNAKITSNGIDDIKPEKPDDTSYFSVPSVITCEKPTECDSSDFFDTSPSQIKDFLLAQVLGIRIFVLCYSYCLTHGISQQTLSKEYPLTKMSCPALIISSIGSLPDSSAGMLSICYISHSMNTCLKTV
ncbi:hypothetical protein OESDEN_23386, partial [Oesophagostomum dentatum]